MEAANHCKTNLSQGQTERASSAGRCGSKSGQINDLATTVHTDLNHNSWRRRGRISVLCSILTTVQQEPRDSALGCIYPVQKILRDLMELNGSHVVEKLQREKKNTSLKMFSPPYLSSSRLQAQSKWHAGRFK